MKVCQTQVLYPVSKENIVCHQFIRQHLTGMVISLSQLFDAPRIDIKTDRPVCPAESYDNLQTDTTQNYEGYLSMYALFAPFSTPRSLPNSCLVMSHQPNADTV
jgi:hypothetical protein